VMQIQDVDNLPLPEKIKAKFIGYNFLNLLKILDTVQINSKVIDREIEVQVPKQNFIEFVQ
jgi:hypothetical protein